MHSFLQAFEDARKKGKFDSKTQQSSFHFTYEKYDIKDVNLLITKKQLDKRFKVDVLMNIDDRRSVILKTNDDLARIHAILTVTLPIVEYDVAGHMNRHDGRRSKIDAAVREMKQHHYADFVASTYMCNQNACEKVHNQVFGRNGQTYLRFMDELVASGFSFKNSQTIDNFSSIIINACCMLAKHFEKDEKGRIIRLPGRFYFFYIKPKNLDRLPTPIADAKQFLNGMLEYYGNFKFYNFCTWLIDLMKEEFGTGFDESIVCALEEERMAKRSMKFDKTSAPSGRRDNKRDAKIDTEENKDVESKPAPTKKKTKTATKVETKPSGVSLGDLFGPQLDNAFGPKA